jgi:hypothetical protein
MMPHRDSEAESVKDLLRKSKSTDTLPALARLRKDLDQQAAKDRTIYPESRYGQQKSRKLWFARLFVDGHHQSNTDMWMLGENLLYLKRESRHIREKYRCISTMTFSTNIHLILEILIGSMENVNEGLLEKSTALRRLRHSAEILPPEAIMNEGMRRKSTLSKRLRQLAGEVRAENTMRNEKLSENLC